MRTHMILMTEETYDKICKALTGYEIYYDCNVVDEHESVAEMYDALVDVTRAYEEGEEV